MGLFGRKKNGQLYPKDKEPLVSKEDENTKKLILANMEEVRVIADLTSGKIDESEAQRRLEPIEKTRIDVASKITGIKVEKKGM